MWIPHCMGPDGSTNIIYQSGPQVKLTHRKCFTITFSLVSCCGRLQTVVFLFKWVVYWWIFIPCNLRESAAAVAGTNLCQNICAWELPSRLRAFYKKVISLVFWCCNKRNQKAIQRLLMQLISTIIRIYSALSDEPTATEVFWEHDCYCKKFVDMHNSTTGKLYSSHLPPESDQKMLLQALLHIS